MSFFDEEHKELHEEREQLRRQKSAKTLTLDYVDFENQTGKIKKYEISLDGCTCVDFIMRQQPCKHIYKLASELGVFQISSKTNDKYLPPTSETQIKTTRDAIKEKIRNVSTDAQLELREFTYRPKPKVYDLKEHPACEELISAGLLVAREVSIEDALEKFTIAQIQKLCTGEKPKKSWRRAQVIDFFKKNYYDIAEQITKEFGTGKIVLNLSQEILENLNAIHRFICSLVGPMPREYDFF